MAHNDLEPVTDPIILKTMESIRETVVDDHVYISTNWLGSHRFVAVPFVSASHFDAKYAATLAGALGAIGCGESYALPTEPLLEEMRCFKVKTTVNGLLEFDKVCSHFNYLLLPRNEAFAILCTTDDYFLVAGPRSFVRDVCGDVDIKRTEFLEFAKGNDRLLRMAKRYLSENLRSPKDR